MKNKLEEKMKSGGIQKPSPVIGNILRENYNIEPPRDKGIGDWDTFITLSIEEQLLQKMIADLPSEGQIEILVSCLRMPELRNMTINLLRDSVAVAKNPSLYPLYFVRSIKNWLSTAEASEKSIVNLFVELANRWHEETDYLSSPSRIIDNDNYLTIISMGNSAIPLILQDLKERGGNWYRALRILSKEDPVSPEARGDVQRMKESWLFWGRDRGYIK